MSERTWVRSTSERTFSVTEVKTPRKPDKPKKGKTYARTTEKRIDLGTIQNPKPTSRMGQGL
jgi:hypothetical protein